MKHLIVARWKENIGWLEDVDGWEPFVVTKDEDTPNIGREASSYFWAFQQLYDRLAPDDLVACVQGDPFPHTPDLLHKLQEGTPGPLGGWHESDEEGHPDHGNLPVRRCWEEWFGAVWPGVVTFTAGAQFITTGKTLLARPKSEYARMQRLVCLEAKGPWVMERFWVSYFDELLVRGTE